MRSRLIVAWIEMFGAMAIAGMLLAIDFIRQQPFSGLADVALSLSLSAIVVSPFLLMAYVGLRRVLSGLPDPRPAPPTAWGMVGIIVLALAVLLALAPALIQL